MGVEAGPLQTDPWPLADHLEDLPDYIEAATSSKECIVGRRLLKARCQRSASRPASPNDDCELDAKRRQQQNRLNVGFSISAKNDHGGCRRWLWGRSGSGLPESRHFPPIARCFLGFAASPAALRLEMSAPNIPRV